MTYADYAKALSHEALATRLEWLADNEKTLPVANREALLREAARRVRLARLWDSADLIEHE